MIKNHQKRGKKMNKKNKRFSTSIPVFIDAVLPVYSASRHTTMAKLKVFHKGITQDGRRFSDGFSQVILSQLPETPVVALYDDENKDFKGHAEHQGVFGYVPETANVYFEEIDGQEWAVTDVRLFTERDDVGAIAKKIVGKQHSLELDPETVEYEFSDEDDTDYWVTFTGGNLIGLSVLGDWQSPAYAGSGFINYESNTPVSLSDIIAKYLSLPKEIEVKQDGGETMFQDFAKNLFGSDVQSVLENDHFLIYRVKDKTYITLLDENQGQVNIDITEAFTPQQPEVEEDAVEDVAEEDVEDPAAEVEDPTEDPADTSGEATGVEDDGEQEPEQVQTEIGVESQAPEAQANQTTLSEKEREELENYRRKDKQGLIKDYTEYLSTESIKQFNNSIDSYTVEELEKELSVEAMKFIRLNKEDPIQDTFAHSFVGQSESNVREAIDVSINKYLKKGIRGEN